MKDDSHNVVTDSSDILNRWKDYCEKSYENPSRYSEFPIEINSMIHEPSPLFAEVEEVLLSGAKALPPFLNFRFFSNPRNLLGPPPRLLLLRALNFFTSPAINFLYLLRLVAKIYTAVHYFAQFLWQNSVLLYIS